MVLCWDSLTGAAEMDVGDHFPVATGFGLTWYAIAQTKRYGTVNKSTKVSTARGTPT